jgi:hypothetical protein
MSIEKVPTLLIDVLFATNKIFGDGIDAENWKSYEYEAGMIRFHGEFCYGPAGIEGTLGIGIPPREAREHDDDAWEASSNALEWDWWSCLGLLTISSSEYDQQIVVFLWPIHSLIGH